MIIKKQTRQKAEQQKLAESIENVEVVEEVETQPIQDQKVPFAISQEELKNDAFSIDKIDFTQRQERRRGDRRRGYRRIDDRNLISRAQEEADQIKESAAKEGYKAGIEESREAITTFQNSLSCFLSAKQEVFEYIAPDILEIAVDIARKIIKKEIEQDPTAIMSMIIDVMDNLSKEETKITIKINPSQADLVRTELPEAISQKGIEARITIMPDDNIDIGGCIFITNNGIIDAGLETQIGILKEALKGM